MASSSSLSVSVNAFCSVSNCAESVFSLSLAESISLRAIAAWCCSLSTSTLRLVTSNRSFLHCELRSAFSLSFFLNAACARCATWRSPLCGPLSSPTSSRARAQWSYQTRRVKPCRWQKHRATLRGLWPTGKHRCWSIRRCRRRCAGASR